MWSHCGHSAHRWRSACYPDRCRCWARRGCRGVRVFERRGEAETSLSSWSRAPLETSRRGRAAVTHSGEREFCQSWPLLFLFYNCIKVRNILTFSLFLFHHFIYYSKFCSTVFIISFYFSDIIWVIKITHSFFSFTSSFMSPFHNKSPLLYLTCRKLRASR